MDSQTITNMKTSDKIIAVVLLAIVGGACAFGISLMLPWLIALMENTIYFAALLAIVVIGGFMVVTEWRTVYYWWMNIARNIRRSVVKSDPIGILQTVIIRFQKQMDDIDKYIVQVDAAIRRLKMGIVSALQNRDKEDNLAKAAQGLGQDLQTKQHAAAAMRWENSAKHQQPLAQQLDGMLAQLKKAREFCQVRLDDIENQKLVLKQELDAVLPGQNVVRKMKGFFGHNPDLEMKEMACEEADRQATEALAEISNFMETMSPMLEAQDLQQTADQTAAMDRFNKFIETGVVEQLPPPQAPAKQIPVAAVARK